MDDDEEHQFYGDSTILEPIIEQQDEEVNMPYKNNIVLI